MRPPDNKAVYRGLSIPTVLATIERFGRLTMMILLMMAWMICFAKNPTAIAFSPPVRRCSTSSPGVPNRVRLLSASRLSMKRSGTTEATSIRNNSTCTTPTSARRKPAFPRSTYHLAPDEEQLDYNFISFIDYTVSPYSQVTRLIEPRFYARSDQFQANMTAVPPTIDDVAPPPSLYGSVGRFLAWNKLPARAVVGTMAYAVFPYIFHVLQSATRTMDDDALLSLVNTFLPGVSIVLGTYFSLTLSILYDRFTRIQETVSLEASLLALTCQHLLDLFSDHADAAVEGTQCVADQIRTLVRENRAREIMGVMYSDPYARILRLLAEQQRQGTLDKHLLSEVRGTVGELFKARSKRMADEALALSPTHFDVMTFLSGLLLTGFALGAVDTSRTDAVPDEMARILFSALIVCYVILYEMAFDLNRPFDGVYQIRRSAAAMHFLEVKHMLCNHPLVGGLVEFDEYCPDNEEERDPDNIKCDDDCKRAKNKTWFN